MYELEISINNSGGEPENELRTVLGDFEEKNRTKIIYSVYEWTVAWGEIMKIVLYKHGPVMSQIGTTWVGSLDATQALRPFTPAEINQLGGVSAYHPAAWKSGISLETRQVTAIPWFLDTYVIYYRKDLLRKAGINEASAFESLDALAETAQKLALAGVAIPLAIPTGVPSRANLHNLAGWVWNYGGEFVSEDGKQLLLSQAKTRQGLKAYFSLYKYMPQAAQMLADADCYRVFLDGSAAITLRNSSLLYTVQHDPIFTHHLGNLGVAAMPGDNFLGGSSFVLWNHISPLDERMSMTLLHELTLPETQYAYFKKNGFLPARLEALKKLEEEPFCRPFVQSLMRGRSFHKMKLWGLIEERLMIAVAQIWQTLYIKTNANESIDLDEEIARVLDPLERRLQLTLSDH
jgi:multiple sugar transport system substrate-binding protein